MDEALFQDHNKQQTNKTNKTDFQTNLKSFWVSIVFWISVHETASFFGAMALIGFQQNNWNKKSGEQLEWTRATEWNEVLQKGFIINEVLQKGFIVNAVLQKGFIINKFMQKVCLI